MRKLAHSLRREPPLCGVRVLDLSEGVAGPYACRLFALYGAEVIKVERPKFGDVGREWGPFWPWDERRQFGGLFIYLNAGKQAVTLDYDRPVGKVLLGRLSKWADIVVENFAPASKSASTLSYRFFRERNQKIVVASISDFGRTGPYRDRVASPLVLSAMSGMLWGIAPLGHRPVQICKDVGEYMTGLYTACSAVGAYFDARESGTGDWLDVSRLEAYCTMPTPMAIQYNWGGEIRRAEWVTTGKWPVPSSKCKDGWVGYHTPSNEHFYRLLEMTGLGHLRDDPRFLHPALRMDNSEALREQLDPWFSSRTQEEVFRLARQYRVPLMPAQTVPQILGNPQHLARKYFRDMSPVSGYQLPAPFGPFTFRGVRKGRERAPQLGQHNRKVYGNLLGLDQTQLRSLGRRGVI